MMFVQPDEHKTEQDAPCFESCAKAGNCTDYRFPCEIKEGDKTRQGEVWARASASCPMRDFQPFLLVDSRLSSTFPQGQPKPPYNHGRRILPDHIAPIIKAFWPQGATLHIKEDKTQGVTMVWPQRHSKKKAKPLTNSKGEPRYDVRPA